MVKVYVEGGGDSGSLHSACRRGFRRFLEKAGFKGRMPGIVACGGRRAAFEDFKTGRKQYEVALLLVDSEDSVSVESPWKHLYERPDDGFERPQGASDDHCHLMVVCMESWFLADKEALSRYFGQGFKPNALPQNPKIEAVSKKDVLDGMQRATSHCKTKGSYAKGRDSFAILEQIDPEKVKKASPWVQRFLDKLADFANRK